MFQITLGLVFTINAKNLDSGYVPTHMVTLTQVVTSVYFGQTHLGTPFQVSAWVGKFLLGSARDDHFFGDVTSFELGFSILSLINHPNLPDKFPFETRYKVKQSSQGK